MENLSFEITTPETESIMFQKIGEYLSQVPIPSKVEVTTPYGNITYSVIKRGKYIENGEEKPSRFIIEENYNLHEPATFHDNNYKEAYLTCIHPESNNYKFYRFIPEADGIMAEYGRIGQKAGEMFGLRRLKEPMPTRMYWIRYYEKLSKGYIDQSDIFLGSEGKSREEKNKPSLNSEAEKLYYKLRSFAKRHVEETLCSDVITEKQVKESRKILNHLYGMKTVSGFNKWLNKLLVLSPRKARYVDLLYANKKEDFKDILEREENLYSAMEGMVSDKVPKKANAFGDIEIYKANAQQVEKVKGMISDMLKDKIVNVWRVIPKNQKKKFNKYLKSHNIKQVKELWHGSKNENWLSIAQNSLKLHPDAVITGKMFGEGLYFAPSSMKSWGYTSAYGSRWANGNSATAFMGIYAVAYGNPYDAVKTAYPFTQQYLDNLGYNCVHAKAALTGLRNDEIIFYSEDAVLLNYLVEFQL